MAGPGAKTAKLAVSINEKPSKLLLPILLPLIVALIIATGVGYMYFKKQRAMGDETTCNPIYLNVSTLVLILFYVIYNFLGGIIFLKSKLTIYLTVFFVFLIFIFVFSEILVTLKYLET